MGGVPPLGYRAQDAKLVIVDSEAEAGEVFDETAGLARTSQIPDLRGRRSPDARRHCGHQWSTFLCVMPGRGEGRGTSDVEGSRGREVLHLGAPSAST